MTGAAGYIGGAIARGLAGAGFNVTGGVRWNAALPAGVARLVTGDLATCRIGLAGLHAVVHAAGLGHRRGLSKAVWRSANVDAAVNVARLAKAGGVSRFVLVSTAHVHGRIHPGVVSDGTAANPMDDYAASKLEAEAQVAAIFGAGLTILRPVAVIGPHCPGNLQLLMKLLHLGLPLPFGAIANRRSFIDVSDLARLARAVLEAPSPPGIVLAASPEAIASPMLIRALAEGMGVRAKLAAVPLAVLRTAAGMLGRGEQWQSLAGDFAADPKAALNLGWAPAKSLNEGLVNTGRSYAVT